MAEPQLELLGRLVHSQDEAELRAAATNPELTEDLAEALLKRRDLPPTVLQDLAKNTAAMKLRSVMAGVVCHVRTPRFVALPLSRQLHTFELLNVALLPSTPVDVKMAVEQSILDRLENMSLGERISLAKRGSTRIAEGLLRDAELKVVELALANSHLTEACVVRALMSEEEVDPKFVEKVANHAKWSLRIDVRCALLRNPNTPMAAALRLAQTMPADVARDALFNSNLPRSVKAYLLTQIQNGQR